MYVGMNERARPGKVHHAVVRRAPREFGVVFFDALQETLHRPHHGFAERARLAVELRLQALQPGVFSARETASGRSAAGVPGRGL